ncbi:MAG: GrpB family protein [Chloroflexi bacterium]|nr:GrpB family protein [Chloroflexota bacterium]
MTQDAPSLPVVIADYDPRWPAMYAEESARIQNVIGRWLLGIEHVGSTSVPGLAAKPVVDIMPGLRSLDEAPHVVSAMETIGYEYRPDTEDELPERRYFVRPPGSASRHRRLFHVHAVEATTEFWRRHLAFRDYLRAHSEVAGQYAALKRRLSAEYGTDHGGYTEAKTEFITRVESIALAGETG